VQSGPLRRRDLIGAFDDTRAPQLDLIEDCVHCGFCLPTCPTYDLWDEEMDSPRGRIVLMRGGLEEGSVLSPEMVVHFDNCLGCMACVTACPSGVRYDELIEDTRAQVERRFRRPLAERLYRRLAFALFPHPGRLRALAPALAGSRRLGLSGLAARFAPPRLATLARLSPQTGVRRALARLPERFEAQGERRGTVALLQGCVQRVFFGEVNEATARVLAAEGFDVQAPAHPRCCGALQLHAGEDARPLARAAIEAFDGYDHVVTNAAGCGSAMKDYAHLLRDDPDWAERAAGFSRKVRDVTELLAAHEPRAERRPLRLRVAYHDACHLAHAQGVRAEPRGLLAAIPGLELVEPAEWEICCGSAGIWNLLNPQPAAELGERKARNLLEASPDAVAAANPGCALQIAAHTRELGSELPVRHPVELLHQSIRGGSDDGRG
jgi:glycolate oxidase iron-sulfur subunit